MRKILILAATLAGLSPGVVYAQATDAMSGMDHGAMASGDAAKTPAACQAAGKASGATMDMPAMSGEMAALDPVQKANHDAMIAMHGPMMQAAMIGDADLAFNCGMIAHHQGAIAMARVELAMGKDEASKTLAQAIIDAQEKEIAEMTAWVEKHAR